MITEKLNNIDTVLQLFDQTGKNILTNTTINHTFFDEIIVFSSLFMKLFSIIHNCCCKSNISMNIMILHNCKNQNATFPFR